MTYETNRYFFDTEFYEDGRVIELISIGIVSEDGREFYAETLAADLLANSTPWLRENVRPHLTGQRKPNDVIRREIMEFIKQGDWVAQPEFWASYAAYDWVVLCQLFGTMMSLPKGWPKFCRDIQQLADGRVAKWPGQEGDEHNALADARYARLCHEMLIAEFEPTPLGALLTEAAIRGQEMRGIEEYRAWRARLTPDQVAAFEARHGCSP